MTHRLTKALLNLRIIGLLTGFGFCAAMVIGASFAKHALDSISDRVDVQQENLLNQVHAISRIKDILRHMEAASEPISNGTHTRIKPGDLGNELRTIWSELNRAGGGDATSQLGIVLSELARSYSKDGGLADTTTHRSRFIKARVMLDELLDGYIRKRAVQRKLAIADLQGHKQELNLLIILMAIVVPLVLIGLYRSIITPLISLGRVAQGVGKGEMSAAMLSDLKIPVAEIAQLRDQLLQMLTDLTVSQRFIAHNVQSMVNLTESVSGLSSQLRNGVIEETAISKDIFADLREMRLGSQQMKQELEKSFDILAQIDGGTPITREQFEALREQLLLVSDVAKGWRYLGDDLGRVLNGFDDMVRDRMTLASRLETLVKEMSVSAHEMAFRTS